MISKKMMFETISLSFGIGANYPILILTCHPTNPPSSAR